jgi:hypothetical protein
MNLGDGVIETAGRQPGDHLCALRRAHVVDLEERTAVCGWPKLMSDRSFRSFKQPNKYGS